MYLEVVQDAVVLHTVLGRPRDLVECLDALYLLELGLLDKGVGLLLSYVDTDTELIYAKLFGFKEYGLTNTNNQIVLIKDLHDVNSRV